MTSLEFIDNFYFKREDQNITGSAKDRAIPLQIENLIKLGFSKAVISSTGNAAISASFYCQQNNIELTTFLSPHTSTFKTNLIKSKIIISSQPISDSIKYSKQNNVYLLRQSTDPVALLGYSAIGSEIIDQLPDITSIFIPVGSGTTLLGISQKLPPSVKIFAVQSSFNPTITSHFDSVPKESNNLTDALTVKYLPLKNKIIETIKKSQGSGITINNQAIISTQSWLQNHQVSTSNEGALALAGAFFAKNNFDIGNFPVILLTGQKR